MKSSTALLAFCAIAGSLFSTASVVLVADACKFRGDLDERYCDENRDLVADTPSDPKRQAPSPRSSHYCWRRPNPSPPAAHR